MSLASFEASINDFIQRQVPEQVAVVQRVVALQILSGVVNMTPVDTGRARANWQVSLETPVISNLEAADKTGSGTIQAGSAIIDGLKPFSVVFVQNNLPYIEVLEGGSSQQAPAGMVSVTLANVAAQFA